MASPVARRVAAVIERCRARARLALLRAASAVATRLPAAVVGAAADAVGELWYRVTPARAAVARRNLGRVAVALAERETGSPRARAAATDPRALERLVRSAYRHAVRTYAELLRARAIARDWPLLIDVENPAEVDAALTTPPAIYVSLHFGSMDVVSHVLTSRAAVPVTAPMETLGDPVLQAFMIEARASGGARLVPLEAARKELRAALGRGENVGLIADRDIAGSGVATSLFGHPAPLPSGAALLALESGVPIHVAAVRRVGPRYRGRLQTLPLPGPGPLRQRVEAILAAEAQAFERIVAEAPDQWWTVFFPIWPDLEAGGAVTAASSSESGKADGGDPGGQAR